MSKLLTASWDAEPGATGYQADYALTGMPWRALYSGPATSGSVRVSQDGTYRVRVRALRPGGVGPYTESSIAVTGATEPLAAALSTTSISGTAPAGSVTTPAVRVNVTGGVAPYRYEWLRFSGDPQIVARDPTSGSTAFVFDLAVGQSLSAVYACRVTDGAGTQATSDSVTLSYSEAAAAPPPDPSAAAPVGAWLEWSSSTPPPGPWLTAGTYAVNDWPELGAFYGVAPGGSFVVPDRSDTMPGGTFEGDAPGTIRGTNTMDLRHKTLPGELKMPAHAHGAGTLQAADHTHPISPTPVTVQSGTGTTVQSAPNTTGASGPLTVTGTTADSTTGPEARITGESEVIDWNDDAPGGRLENPALAKILPRRFFLVWYQRAASF